VGREVLFNVGLEYLIEVGCGCVWGVGVVLEMRHPFAL